MKDADGNNLQIGDRVLMGSYGNHVDSCMQEGWIVGFSAKQISVLTEKVVWKNHRETRSIERVSKKPGYVAKAFRQDALPSRFSEAFLAAHGGSDCLWRNLTHISYNEGTLRELVEDLIAINLREYGS